MFTADEIIEALNESDIENERASLNSSIDCIEQNDTPAGALAALDESIEWASALLVSLRALRKDCES